MALNPLVDSRDVRFVLFEMLNIDSLTGHESFAAFDRETFEASIELAEKIAVGRVYPMNSLVDKEGGARYDSATGSVSVHKAYKSAMAYFNEAGFTGLGSDPGWGGMGMPDVMYRTVLEYFFAASLGFTMHVTLSVGAANLVKKFAPENLKKIYLEKMISGQWGGTMCLTEPEAGSDVGALKTKALRQDDGTYLITGQKIFISSGDNDLYENMVHPVLARIEGDPPGTKGISIFLVPKYFSTAGGGIGERNDVVCTGIEHKMGIKGSATCSLCFGDNGACTGYLMGEERAGMKIMFHMMNEARLDVAIEALGVAGSAYMHAVTYARTRVQGNPPAGGGSSAAIIGHPDVKRMLLWMKSHVEAMRMITMLAAYSTDRIHTTDGEQSREAQALLDFLIPICKAGNTDLAWLITAEAIQVFGGYGYCSDYPVEQLARDSKILSLYEGTNGIQSIDLTLRKLLLNPGMYNYSVLKKEIFKTLDNAMGVVDEKYIKTVRRGVEKMDAVIRHLSGRRESGLMADILALAVPLQQAFRMLCHAWMHLWSMSVSMPKLKAVAGSISGEPLAAIVRENPEAAFYYGKVLSARFFLASEFSKYSGLLDYLLSGEEAVSESFNEIFSGAPEQ